MKKIRALSVVIALSSVSISAQAIEIYNNGPVVDGEKLSITDGSSWGWGAQTNSNNRIGEDFSITAGEIWNIESINFFAYQTGSTSFTFQTANWSIISGDINSGTIVASGITSVTDNELVGYRVTTTTTTNTQRGIYSIAADVSDFSLSTGNYWLTWSLAGSLSSGPWVPGIANNPAGGNAVQSILGAAFAPLTQTGSETSVTLPFALNGTVSAVPEPTSLSLMLGGLALLGGASRRRSAV
ncbi:hypothetical protein GCM10027046_18990 [Uliginosibacterium flavum]|uniref:PEP-CTERM sorting domain-containing protein n=1 Tax=Uliginosibacterium flavum TaxID=1396831 RepID=A0ABV2TFN0_9RHOO